MKIMAIRDIEGLLTPEGIIKPLLFTDKVGLLYIELPARFDVTPHSHPQDNILYCIEGVVEVSSEGKTTTISADSVIFVPANEVAGIKNLGDEPARLLCVSTPPVVKSAEKFKELLKSFQKER
jgi:quercetin dioxygenase-like cupin family protein